MKQKNYAKFSEKSENKEVVPAEELNPLATEPIVEEVNEVTEVVDEKEPTIVTGVVVGCDKLNIRAEPSTDAKVLRVINKDHELGVYPTPIGDFYKVVEMETEGYCMTKYINIK